MDPKMLVNLGILAGAGQGEGWRSLRERGRGCRGLRRGIQPREGGLCRRPSAEAPWQVFCRSQRGGGRETVLLRSQEDRGDTQTRLTPEDFFLVFFFFQ